METSIPNSVKHLIDVFSHKIVALFWHLLSCMVSLTLFMTLQMEWWLLRNNCYGFWRVCFINCRRSPVLTRRSKSFPKRSRSANGKYLFRFVCIILGLYMTLYFLCMMLLKSILRKIIARSKWILQTSIRLCLLP